MFTIGILTYNRPDFFGNLISSIKALKCNLIVVNDGQIDVNNQITQNLTNCKQLEYIKHKQKLTIARSKNQIFNFFLEKTNDEYLFIIEDDVIIKDINVFERYIQAADVSGIMHFMWHAASPNNLERQDEKIIEYPEGLMVGFYYHCIGSFCFYSRELIKAIGFFDEKYKNAIEHIDFSYRCVLAGFLPGYNYWPDIYPNEPGCFIIDQDPTLKNSTITTTRLSNEIIEADQYFKSKFGFSTFNTVRNADFAGNIINIRRNHSKSYSRQQTNKGYGIKL